jgi:hypothetical protein
MRDFRNWIDAFAGATIEGNRSSREKVAESTVAFLCRVLAR